MPPLVIAIIVGILLFALGIVALRRASSRTSTIIARETSPQATGQPQPAWPTPDQLGTEQPDPDRDWARAFLVATYGLKPDTVTRNQDYWNFTRALYGKSGHPRSMDQAVDTMDPAAAFAKAEELAGVLSDRQLGDMVGNSSEYANLWRLRDSGSLPRWVTPFLSPSFNRDSYHDELWRRLEAAQTH